MAKKMANKDLKTLVERAYTCEVRAEDGEESSIITGTPIVFNSATNLGYFDEIIEENALDNTDLTDVRFLVNHDISKIPLARSRRNNGNSTMQLSVMKPRGMDIKVVLDTKNNADAKALFSAVKREDITGMSFMFSIDDEEWENLESDHPTRRIKAIGSVVEVSAVTFPAYDATTINARSKEALDNARSVLEKARQQEAEAVETVKDELQLLKLKTKILGGH